MTARLQVAALRLTVFLGEDDQWRHKPLDTESKIRSFAPRLEELIGEGLVIVEPVEVIRYTSRTEAAR
jgi:PII-like signaling protein